MAKIAQYACALTTHIDASWLASAGLHGRGISLDPLSTRVPNAAHKLQIREALAPKTIRPWFSPQNAEIGWGAWGLERANADRRSMAADAALSRCHPFLNNAFGRLHVGQIAAYAQPRSGLDMNVELNRSSFVLTRTGSRPASRKNGWIYRANLYERTQKGCYTGASS